MLFRKKVINKEPVDVDTDLKAVKNFLHDIGGDIKNIFYLCQEMEKLMAKEKELKENKAPEQSIRKNFEEQVKVWDKMLTVYEFFDEDEDVNAERVKNIAKELRKKAKEINPNSEKVKSLQDALAKY